MLVYWPCLNRNLGHALVSDKVQKKWGKDAPWQLKLSCKITRRQKLLVLQMRCKEVYQCSNSVTKGNPGFSFASEEGTLNRPWQREKTKERAGLAWWWKLYGEATTGRSYGKFVRPEERWQSVNKHLLDIYYVPDISPSPGDPKKSKNTILVFKKPTTYGRWWVGRGDNVYINRHIQDTEWKVISEGRH